MNWFYKVLNCSYDSRANLHCQPMPQLFARDHGDQQIDRVHVLGDLPFKRGVSFGCFSHSNTRRVCNIPLFEHILCVPSNTESFHVRQKQVSGLWSPRASPQTNASTFCIFFFVCYDRLEFCRAVCFKRLFRIGVWTFARFARPLIGPRVSMYHIISLLANKQKQKRWPKKNASPHRFWSPLMTGNWILFLALDSFIGLGSVKFWTDLIDFCFENNSNSIL